MSGTAPVSPTADTVRPRVVVAGHICLDLVPQSWADDEPCIPAGGMLHHIGPLQVAPGGCVANTGLALGRLGVRPHLIAPVGEDVSGDLLRLLIASDPNVSSVDLVRVPGHATSYSLVIEARNRDRSFLHYPGVNDALRPETIAAYLAPPLDLLHFGYPPIMRQTYADGGRSLRALFDAVHEYGGRVSMDLAMPAANARHEVHWRSWLETVLPAVDYFTPGMDELGAMLDAQTPSHGPPSLTDIRRAAYSLLQLGPAVVMIKLGALGLYVQTAKPALNDRADEYYAPALARRVVSSTGAGDVTSAAMVAGLLAGLPVDQALLVASRAAARSVSTGDPISALSSWDVLLHEPDEPRTAGEAIVSVRESGWNSTGTIWRGPGPRF